MKVEIALERMTVDEKLQLMEALWTSLSKHPEAVEMPDWHKRVLDERMQKLKQGETQFEDWEQAKQQLREEFGWS